MDATQPTHNLKSPHALAHVDDLLSCPVPDALARLELRLAIVKYGLACGDDDGRLVLRAWERCTRPRVLVLADDPDALDYTARVR